MSHTIRCGLLVLCTCPAVAAGASFQGELEVTEKSSLTVSEKCLAVLRQGLASEEFWPAMHAAEALTQVGHGSEVKTVLEKKLSTEREDPKRTGLARELARAGDRGKTAILLEVLATPDLKARIAAAEALFKVNEIGDGQLLRKAMAQEESLSLKMMAAGALATKKDKEAMAVLRKTLAGKDTEGRMLAGFLIGRLGDKSDVPQLLKNAEADNDPVNKAFAYYAAAILGDARGREYIAKNIHSENKDVRTYAAEAAGAARLENLVPELIKLLDDPVLDIRIRAAQAILLIGASKK